MKVQGNLIWDKHSGELIGYVNLGDPDINFATFKKVDEIASHALLFMFFVHPKVYAWVLFPIFWKAVSILEITCNLAVVGATADGASPNRRLFFMHGTTEKAVL